MDPLAAEIGKPVEFRNEGRTVQAGRENNNRSLGGSLGMGHTPAGVARFDRFDRASELRAQIEMLGVGFKIRDHLIPRGITRAFRHWQARKARAAPRCMQVQAVVVATPAVANFLARIEDFRGKSGPFQTGRSGEPRRPRPNNNRTH